MPIIPRSTPKRPRDCIILNGPCAVGTAAICHLSTVAEGTFLLWRMSYFLYARAFLANHDTLAILLPMAYPSRHKLPRNCEHPALLAALRGIDPLILTLTAVKYPVQVHAGMLKRFFRAPYATSLQQLNPSMYNSLTTCAFSCDSP